jgi:hypothetical protein
MLLARVPMLSEEVRGVLFARSGRVERCDSIGPVNPQVYQRSKSRACLVMLLCRGASIPHTVVLIDREIRWNYVPRKEEIVVILRRKRLCLCLSANGSAQPHRRTSKRKRAVKKC